QRRLFLRQPSSRLMPFAQRLSFPPALFLRPLSFRPPLFLQPLFSRQVPFLRRLSSVQRPFRQQLSLLQLFPPRPFPRPGDVLPLRVFFALRALSRWQYPDPPLEPGGLWLSLRLRVGLRLRFRLRFGLWLRLWLGFRFRFRFRLGRRLGSRFSFDRLGFFFGFGRGTGIALCP